MSNSREVKAVVDLWWSTVVIIPGVGGTGGFTRCRATSADLRYATPGRGRLVLSHNTNLSITRANALLIGSDLTITNVLYTLVLEEEKKKFYYDALKKNLKKYKCFSCLTYP